MPASSTQPVTAELTFMFMYKTPGNEGDCVPLFSIFPIPTASIEPSRTLLPLHPLSLTFGPVVPQTVLHQLLKIQITGLQLTTMESLQ